MDTTILRKAGLTESQARGYLALIENGALTPTQLAEITGETRTNAYAVAGKLVELGLAIKQEGSKNAYLPDSPSKLKQLLVNRQRALKTANDELSGLLPSLMSSYRLTTDKPGVLYLEGVDSLQLIYDDVIKTKETLLIFPSAHDTDDPEVADMINRQIERQRNANIGTKALLREEIFERFSSTDALFEAKSAQFQALDTQIMIYGNNIAMTTFKKGVVSTIITNEQMAQTFKQLFFALWRQPHQLHTKND